MMAEDISTSFPACKVSIIMPTFNTARFISESIESVLKQTFQQWELLVIDDFSTDNSKDIIAKFLNDNRIHYILNTNKGAAYARNLGLSLARGRWIAFLDSDDIWAPEKLERQIKFMTDNGYAFSYHDYHEIAEDGSELGIRVSGKRKVSVFDMFACCWPGCLSVMYDREKIGLLQVENIKKNNDTAIWLKAIQKSPCYLLKEDLASYRRRKGSITPNTLFQKIWAHYPLFRDAERMSPFIATFWTLMNVLGNGYKKLFYIKKYPPNNILK